MGAMQSHTSRRPGEARTCVSHLLANHQSAGKKLNAAKGRQHPSAQLQSRHLHHQGSVRPLQPRGCSPVPASPAVGVREKKIKPKLMEPKLFFLPFLSP